MLSLGEGEGREIEERGMVEHGSAFFFFFAFMFFFYFGFYWVLKKVFFFSFFFFLVLEFFFKYCADVENCGSFKSFDYIYIYIYILTSRQPVRCMEKFNKMFKNLFRVFVCFLFISSSFRLIISISFKKKKNL